MTMKPLAKLLAGAAIAMAAATGGAYATPTTLSIGVTGLGPYAVNTGNITLTTANKAIPSSFLVTESSTPTAAAAAGIIPGATLVSFDTTTLRTTVGTDDFTLSVGDLVFTFTNVSSAITFKSATSCSMSPSCPANSKFTGAGVPDVASRNACRRRSGKRPTLST